MAFYISVVLGLGYGGRVWDVGRGEGDEEVMLWSAIDFKLEVEGV